MEYIIAFSALSAITFILYGIDKGLAKVGAHRISEKVLLLLGFVSGGVGGLLGMVIFRHKTKHIYFWIVNVLAAALAVCALLALQII